MNDIKAAVAVIFDGPEIVLGKGPRPDDLPLDNKWIFPGGGVNPGEDPVDAAVREAKEETGLDVVPVEGVKPFIHPDKPEVLFVKCKFVGGELKPNHEFAEMEWFDLHDLPSPMVPMNLEVLKQFNDVVEEMIQRVRIGEHMNEIIMKMIR